MNLRKEEVRKRIFGGAFLINLVESALVLFNKKWPQGIKKGGFSTSFNLI